MKAFVKIYVLLSNKCGYIFIPTFETNLVYSVLSLWLFHVAIFSTQHSDLLSQREGKKWWKRNEKGK